MGCCRKCKGYVIAVSEGSSYYIDGAEHIERDDSCIPWVYENDEEAARAAEADGIRLIYDMPGVPDGVYVDTPKTRAILVNHVQSSSEQTSFFSPERSESPVKIAAWKYKVLRFFANRCHIAHEVLPIEGNILYTLIHCNTASLRPVIESLQKDCNVYVQMDSFEDSTLLAVMKELEHAPAELTLKHRLVKDNLK